jgi:hypothetical protein
MAMSAAEAIDDNSDAAPAAMKNLTLRIGFVLLAVRQTAPHRKLTPGRWHQMLKRRLTLIFKVDNSRTEIAVQLLPRQKMASAVTMANDV